MTGTIFRIARFSVHDGPGIRTTVFLKGCPLRCAWCHSPESQHPQPQLGLRLDRCIACGNCAPACAEHGIAQAEGGGAYVTDFTRCRACGNCIPPCGPGTREMVGRRVTVNEVLSTIERDVVFFDESSGGATFSGGEPLMQPAFVTELLLACRDRGIHTALDTSGMADTSTFAAVALLPDLILFDLKLVDNARHRRLTGASNALVLQNLRTLAAGTVPVRIRFPLVPTITDDELNVTAIAELLRSLGLRRIHVLPYHRAGVAKYARIGAEYSLPDVDEPTPDRVAEVEAMLTSRGLEVSIGG